MKRAPPPKASISGALVVLLLKVIWAAFVVMTPVLGAWVASSLAAYLNGPVALAALSGFLLFPTLPLAWDAWAGHRRRRRAKGVVKPAILTFWDRLILRTLAINLAFLGILLATHPQTGFTALSTRGDWMLEGQHGPQAEAARKRLFWAADRLEWLYLAAADNPFDKPDLGGSSSSSSGGVEPRPEPRPEPQPSADATAKPKEPLPQASASASAKPNEPPPRPADPKPAEASPEWPAAGELHSVVAQMPSSSEESLANVARYIADRETDPLRRAKALHDWVADRIAYDGVAYMTRSFPPQDAEAVFRTRKGVCAGYAKLFAAMGKAVGFDVTYVVGDARTSGMKETGESHAWNAITIGGRSYLVDVTWDSGSLDGSKFTKHYRTDYFLTPAEVFGLDHFPNEARWQLRDKPISRGDFMRQPMMSPRFYAEARELLSPTRSQVSVKGSVLIELNNPRSLYTLASFVTAEAEDHEGQRCKVEGSTRTTVKCDLPAPGRYAVRLFSNEQQFGSYHYIGQIEANNTP